MLDIMLYIIGRKVTIILHIRKYFVQKYQIASTIN